MFFLLIYSNRNASCLNICYNHRVLKITWILLLLTNHWATVLSLITYVYKISRKNTNMLGSLMTNNNSKILLRPLWFLLLKDSLITVPDLPWPQHQSINQVLENKCVFSRKRKLISVNPDLLNQSKRQLNQQLGCGQWKQSEK